MLYITLSPRISFDIGVRAFSVSFPKQEAKYAINGSEYTRTSVMAVHPTERTVAQWSILVDWDLQRSRNYVIVDPLDPSGLLYLNHAEYLAQSKVCASNDLMLIVVARPGTKRPEAIAEPSDSSQNSPWGVKIESSWGRDSRLTWKTFLKLRANVARIVNRKAGTAMVSETSESLVRSVLVWVRQLAHYTELRNPETYGALFVPLVMHLQRILKNNGRMAVVQHLKLSLFALYSYISGNPIKSTQPLGWGIRLRTCGLPRVWPLELVNRIKQGHISVIRLMASLLNLYKAMDAPHPEFSLDSIEKAHPDLANKDFEKFQEFCRDVLPTLLSRELKANGHSGHLDFKYRSALGLIIQSAGANISGPAMSSIIRDAQAWALQPKNHVSEWFQLHGDKEMDRLVQELSKEAHGPTHVYSKVQPGFNQDIYDSMSDDGKTSYMKMFAPTTIKVESEFSSFSQALLATRSTYAKDLSLYPPWSYDQEEVAKGDGKVIPNDFPTPVLGRLHAIDEPAGKVRVVAICDYFTQAALKPVHDHLLDILRFISTDATFDQTGRTESYFQKGLTPHWSFDLKTATDTIPLALYKEVLRPLLRIRGEDSKIADDRVNLWAKIATDRDFITPDGLRTVRYGTGQPMGALSSWASMAIVHHALVQFAAWKRAETKLSWYQHYLVLGDDIDIACSEAVADGYRSACESFQIVIGLIKSLRSKRNCFEFANQRYCPEGNISPISFKEELQAQTWMGRLEYAKRILTRFGTTLKDEASALMLKASTAAQWKVVIPERSGQRPKMILNLIRFCLLTPFTGKEIRLDSVMSWLGPVLRKEDFGILTSALESPERMKDLEATVTKALLHELLLLVQKQLNRMPSPFSVIPKGAALDPKDPRQADLIKKLGRKIPFQGLHPDSTGKSCSLDISRFFQGTFTPSLTRDGSHHPGCLIAMTYLMWSIDQHNDKIRRDLLKIRERLERLLKPRMLDMEFVYWYKIGEPYSNPVSTAIGLWDELVSLPQPIIPDFRVGIGKWMVGDPEPTSLQKLFDRRSGQYRNRILQERLRGPMASIALALARHLGITIPPVPYHVRKQGGNWSRNLKEMLNLYRLESQVDISFKFAELINSASSSEYHTILQEEGVNLPGEGLEVGCGAIHPDLS